MTRQILGDKKCIRYDESLIDKVNARYAKEVVNVEKNDSSPEKDVVVNSGFEVFAGQNYVRLMPKIADKDALLGMNGIMKRRVFGSEEDRNYFRNYFFSTVDGCACAPDGSFKLVYDCELLKGVNSKSVLFNGALILEDGVYENLKGVEFSSGDRKYANMDLSESEAKREMFWLAFARNDQELLNKYVEEFFKFLKNNCDIDKGMRVVLPEIPKKHSLRAWCLGGFNYNYVRSSARGYCSLDYYDGFTRLVRVVAPEAQK